MLEINNLSKHYGAVQALGNISLKIRQGEIIGLFGENGAGKTTLMKSILGLVGYSGEITLDGQPITRKNIARISFATSEHSFFPDLTAAGHMEFYRDHFEKFSGKRFDGLMDFFGLKKHTPIRRFSSGQQNQFEVVLSLCQGADYILMDEPFAGNDIFNREDFYKVLSGILEPHETVLLSTHLIGEVSGFIGRAVLLRRGRIVADTEISELEEKGMTLTGYIKEMYNYRPDRVSRAIDELAGGDDNA